MASLILVYPIVFLWKRASGRIRTAVVIALSFFFLFEFLKIPDMALGEKYESIFAPIRHFLCIAAIPLLGYVYLRKQADELGAAFDTLETKVDERTRELKSALHQVEIEVSKKEQTANEMGAFAYSVAHDLRAPLRSMEGFAQEQIFQIFERLRHRKIIREPESDWQWFKKACSCMAVQFPSIQKWEKEQHLILSCHAHNRR